MFTLTLFDLEYETSVYLGIWNDDCNKMIVLPSFQLPTRLNSQNSNETEILNEFWHINLCMDIGIPMGIIEISPQKMKFLTLFQFLARLLTSMYLKLFSSHLVGRNGSMWITCFSAPQNAKKLNQLKHKNQVRNRLLLSNMSSSM